MSASGTKLANARIALHLIDTTKHGSSSLVMGTVEPNMLEGCDQDVTIIKLSSKAQFYGKLDFFGRDDITCPE